MIPKIGISIAPKIRPRAIPIPKEKILKGKFDNIELGICLRFRENMDGIINGFVYHKGFPKAYEYFGESVTYKADAYSVSYYDKISEIFNKKEKALKENRNREFWKNGITEKKKQSKKRLAEKIKKNNFLLRFEVRVNKPSGCPPEFLEYKNGVKTVLISTPEDLLNNWDTILTGLIVIFEETKFSEYNLNAGINFLENKGLKELYLYETHIVASLLGGVDNYTQKLLGCLKNNHRDKNIRKKIEMLNSPPMELKEALKDCRNKKDVLYKAKDDKIISMLK